jgi:hypothetical protein
LASKGLISMELVSYLIFILFLGYFPILKK